MKDKSILVIDTPEECGDCPCVNLLGIYCQADKRNRYCLLENRKEWCPLKPMPQYMTMKNTVSCDYNEAFVNGFNTCIDEILGEENE